MAKRSVKEDPLVEQLESIDAGLSAVGAATEPPVILPFPTPPAEPPVCRDLQVAVPYLPGGTGYSQQHLDISLSAAQALALRGIVDGLDKHHARLANGRRVVNAPDAIRWLLEEAAIMAAGQTNAAA